MKKRSKLSKILTLVVLGVVLACVLAVVFIDRLAKTGIQAGGTAALGVPTRVDAVHVGLISGQADIADLRVGNPAGFKAPHFLTLHSGAVAVTIPSLMKDTIEVPYIMLEGVDLYVEKNKDGQANYQVIMGSQKQHESKKTEPAKSDEGKKLIIKEVKITNVTMHTDGLSPLGPVKVVVPEILLTNVGTADGAGVGTAEVINVIVKAIFASAIANGAGLLPADVLKDMNAGLDQLSSLTGNSVQIAGKALEDATRAAGEKLGTATEKAGTKINENVEKGAENVEKGVNKGLGNLLK